MFWILSLLILLLAGVIALWPLFGKNSVWKIPAMTMILLFPLIGYMLYQGVGTPEAIDMKVAAPVDAHRNAQNDSSTSAGAPSGDMNVLAEGLRQRLNENPEDAQGWILLARSYKTLEKYQQAIEALETASRLLPNEPLIQVELVEARLFNSDNPRISDEMVAVLEQAVEADPTLQKGLWLLGIAASQEGDDVGAVRYWERLQNQLEPGSQIEQTIKVQLAEAKARLGLESAPTPVSATPGEWPGTRIRVELSEAASEVWSQLPQGEVPAGTILFVIARPEGVSGGPPLGARRVEQPKFPLDLRLTDKDSMMAQRPISSAAGLVLQARLSRTGQPTASVGDWQSVALPVAGNDEELKLLVLDQLVP